MKWLKFIAAFWEGPAAMFIKVWYGSSMFPQDYGSFLPDYKVSRSQSHESS